MYACEGLGFESRSHLTQTAPHTMYPTPRPHPTQENSIAPPRYPQEDAFQAEVDRPAGS